MEMENGRALKSNGPGYFKSTSINYFLDKGKRSQNKLELFENNLRDMTFKRGLHQTQFA